MNNHKIVTCIKFFVAVITITTTLHLVSNVTVTTPEQLQQYSSPAPQGFLDRLTFANPQNAGNGTGTSYIPFSISGRTVANDQCNTMTVQPDGCILLAGLTTATNGTTFFALARYLPSGQLDPTFGQVGTARAGTQYIPFTIAGGVEDTITCIALQNDGKIVVAGGTNDATPLPDTESYFALARFTTSGQLDTTFGQIGPKAGTQYIAFGIAGGILDQLGGIAIQNDNKIILCGASYNAGETNSYFAVARFTQNGQLDTTFGGTGGATPGTQSIPNIKPGEDFDFGNSLLLQSNGKILISGMAGTFFAIACFTETGQLDTSFGGGVSGALAGTQCITIHIAGGATDTQAGLALQSDGKIIVSGASADATNTIVFFCVSRFTPNGQLDTTFGGFNGATPGTQYIPYTTVRGGTADLIGIVTTQPDNKLLLAGFSNNVGGANFFSLARFLPNGQIDTATFGNVGTTQPGTTYIPFSISGQTAFDTGIAVALQSPNKIVVAGTSSNTNAAPFYFAVSRFVN